MWEKIRVVFTIPELRTKILLTLVLLAIYRIGWQIPLPIVDSAKMANFFKATEGQGLGRLIEQVAVFSASQLSQATIFGLGINAVHLGVDYFPASGERLPAAGTSAKRRRKRQKKDQRIHPLRHRGLVPGAKLVLRPLPGAGQPHRRVDGRRRWRPGLRLAVDGRADHDRRHRVPDVARRADRRVRDRQRHQLADHGRHLGPHARRRISAHQAGLRGRVRAGRCSGPSGRGNAAGADRAVHMRRRRRGVHHPGPTPHSHAERQARARPTRIRRQPAVPCRCA